MLTITLLLSCLAFSLWLNFRLAKLVIFYEIACGLNEELAGMFYGNVWKKVIIDRPELWIGIRSDPTFPQRGTSLGGKTYFIDTI